MPKSIWDEPIGAYSWERQRLEMRGEKEPCAREADRLILVDGTQLAVCGACAEEEGLGRGMPLLPDERRGCEWREFWAELRW